MRPWGWGSRMRVRLSVCLSVCLYCRFVPAFHLTIKWWEFASVLSSCFALRLSTCLDIHRQLRQPDRTMGVLSKLVGLTALSHTLSGPLFAHAASSSVDIDPEEIIAPAADPVPFQSGRYIVRFSEEGSAKFRKRDGSLVCIWCIWRIRRTPSEDPKQILVADIDILDRIPTSSSLPWPMLARTLLRSRSSPPRSSTVPRSTSIMPPWSSSPSLRHSPK